MGLEPGGGGRHRTEEPVYVRVPLGPLPSTEGERFRGKNGEEKE